MRRTLRPACEARDARLTALLTPDAGRPIGPLVHVAPHHVALGAAGVVSALAVAFSLALHAFLGVPVAVLAVLTAVAGLAVGCRLPTLRGDVSAAAPEAPPVPPRLHRV